MIKRESESSSWKCKLQGCLREYRGEERRGDEPEAEAAVFERVVREARRLQLSGRQRVELEAHVAAAASSGRVARARAHAARVARVRRGGRGGARGSQYVQEVLDPELPHRAARMSER